MRSSKLSSNKEPLKNTIFQSILAIITLFGILAYFGVVARTAIVAALGATTFIVFATPNSKTAEPRRVIGGHAVGLTIATACILILRYCIQLEISYGRGLIHILLIAISVGLSMFFMAITDTQHPPAAGSAFGLMISGFEYGTVVFVLGCAIILSITRRLLRKWMVDLF